MNLSLLDPFVVAQDCPEVLSGRLRNARVFCLHSFRLIKDRQRTLNLHTIQQKGRSSSLRTSMVAHSFDREKLLIA